MFVNHRNGVRRLAAGSVIIGLMLGGSGFPSARAGTSAPADPVIVAQAVTKDGALAMNEDPQAAVWSRVAEEAIDLNLAPPVHPSIALSQEASRPASSSPLALHVSAITDGQRLYVRLRWKDTTLDNRRGVAVFPDGAAIETPFADGETSPVMGSPEKPVSIWRWDAAKNDVEALAAGSPGTLTRTADETLHGKGTYRSRADAAKNEWLVVISESLDQTGDGRASLRTRKQFPAAFAVWQGSARQRGGFKRVSGWIPVRLPD